MAGHHPGTTGLPSVERALLVFGRFPGVGRKSAQRMVYHLLRSGPGACELLIEAVSALRDRVGQCRECFNLAEGERCAICTDPEREAGQLCVVEEPADLWSMERAGVYRGLYHVLGGRLSPLDGIGPEQLHLAGLDRRLATGTIRELIVATNPTVQGEATAHLVVQMVAGRVAVVSRLAYGLPMGGELEYVDESTLYQAISGRRPW